jgi:hypothetical protein
MHQLDNPIMNSNAVQPHLDCLIHLGAGRCRELDEHLERDPGLLVLVEVDPQLTRYLERRLVDKDNAQVINAGIAAESGERTYYCYNLPDVNGLRQATAGLRELYPGLRLLEERPVQALGIRQLLNSLDLGSESSNGLIVELAGEEAAVLEGLEADDRLHHFCEIELVVGRDAFYADATPASQVLDWLIERGFEVCKEFATQDPDRPRWRLRRDDRVLELRELRAQVFQIGAERDERAAQAASVAKEIKILEQTRENLAKKLRLVEDQLGQSQRASEQREQKLREEADRRVAELQLEVDNLRKQLTAERDEQTTRTNSMMQELEKVKSDLSVAIRLQALREADLKEMQSRYADAIEVRDQQHELLVQLRQRLGSAADFLKQLGAKPIDDNERYVASELLRALDGDDGTNRRAEMAETEHR